MSRLLTAVVAAIVIVALLAGCGGQASPSASPSTSSSTKSSASPAPSAASSAPAAASAHDKWKADYEQWEKDTLAAAKKEGKVVVYPFTASPEQDAVVKAFQNKYGIPVESVPLRSAEAIAKIQQEQSSRNYVVDVRETGSPSIRGMVPDGLIDDFVPPAAKEPGVDWLLDPLLDKDGKLTFYGMAPWYILVNNNLVPADQRPKGYKELEDAKWKNKMMVDDPRAAGPGNRWFAFAYTTWGEEHVKKVLGNATIGRNSIQDPRDAARGEYAVYIHTQVSYVEPLLALKPRPFTLLQAEEGIMVVLQATGIVKNAPHPNAAKLLINFRATKEGQEASASVVGIPPIRKDVKPVDAELAAVHKYFPGNPSTREFELGPYTEMSKKANGILQSMGR